MKIILV